VKVDGGIIFETDHESIVSRVLMKGMKKQDEVIETKYNFLSVRDSACSCE
jgi:hypothetical protein